MKTRTLRTIVGIGLVGFFLACEKKPLPETTETEKPEFYLDAFINGEHFYLYAGENKYFMYSSYYLDTNRVYVLKADLHQSDCDTQCGYGISVLINDKKTSLENDPIEINQALQTGSYVYRDNKLPPLFYQAIVKPLRNESHAEKFRWVLNGQSVESYTASALVENGKYFTPALFFEDAEGFCSTSHGKQFKVGNPLQSNIEVQKEGMPDVLMYSFSANTKGSPPYRYNWQFGDGGSTSNSEHPFHTYKNQGFYTAKLTLTDANNDTCVSFYQVPAFIDPRCEANFTTSFTPLPNTKAFSAITILLTHPDGRIFSSQNLTQSPENQFEILEVSDYEPNNYGEPTKKIKIRFNCVVQSGLDQIRIDNAEAILAVSYK